MAKTVPVDEIPEVQEYLTSKARLDEWIRVNEGSLQPLRDLMEDVDTKRQAADKVVKAKGVLCGPWTEHSKRVEIDVNGLVDHIGLEHFLAIGGEKSTVVQYGIDKKKLDSAIATGAVPPDVANIIRKEKIAYSAPKEPKL